MLKRLDPKEFLSDYYGRLGHALALNEARVAELTAVRKMWLAARDRGAKVVFVGNGGSAAIASHLAVDLAKNGGVCALCFNEASLITCLANDYGYENWVARAVDLYGAPGDCLVAISSSGRSPNILAGVDAARTKGMEVVTCSGFDPENPLRRAGDINMWVDSRAYNIVETTHQAWMMSVIDLIIGAAEYPAS